MSKRDLNVGDEGLRGQFAPFPLHLGGMVFDYVYRKPLVSPETSL